MLAALGDPDPSLEPDPIPRPSIACVVNSADAARRAFAEGADVVSFAGASDPVLGRDEAVGPIGVLVDSGRIEFESGAAEDAAGPFDGSPTERMAMVAGALLDGARLVLTDLDHLRSDKRVTEVVSRLRTARSSR